MHLELSRRQFLRSTGLAALGLFLPACTCVKTGPTKSSSKRNPNVIIILSDDQGYGDFSCHGNPVLKTPNLDKMHSESVRLTDFHVAPICTPTRSQIMTGKDALANGAYCVCSGHEFIHNGIRTMADIFAASGYRTGLFGKWHLGDNYPYRPQDRGFQEVLSFGGWGLVSTSAYWANEYMDPWLTHNGKLIKKDGYCTDIFFDETMKWIESCNDSGEPFFVYLPTNTPHGPIQVPDRYRKKYQGYGKAAGFFGMIDNLDENIGRLDTFLKTKGFYEDTIVIYMNDNGGTGGNDIYNAGMMGRKADYYEGGHRAACFVRWPASLKARNVDSLAQTQDLLPTLIDLCGLKKQACEAFDGKSLFQLLRTGSQPELAERMLVVQCAVWEEYEGANKWQAAVLWKKWRLIKGSELYDVANDPGQTTDVASKYPDIVKQMRDFYELWWTGVEPLAKEFGPIYIGSSQERETVLTAHNWVAPNTANQDWIRNGIKRNGPWHVYVEKAGDYEIALRRWPIESDLPIAAPATAYKGKLANYPAGKALPIAKAKLRIADREKTKTVSGSDKASVFGIKLPAGRTTLQTWFYDESGKELCGAYYVYIKKL